MGQQNGKLSREMRAAAVTVLRIAGEQCLAAMPDPEHLELGSRYGVSEQWRDQLHAEWEQHRRAEGNSPRFGAVLTRVDVPSRRDQSDPPEALFYLLQVGEALDLLDEPEPGCPPAGAYTALFRHVYVHGRDPKTFRGGVREAELVDTVGHQLGKLSYGDLTIIRSALLAWRRERKDPTNAERQARYRAKRKADLQHLAAHPTAGANVELVPSVGHAAAHERRLAADGRELLRQHRAVMHSLVRLRLNVT
jgi:hypothetical protein